MVEFGLMGPFQVRHHGTELRVGGPRERAVLARLVLDAGRVVSVDRLIDTVWQGAPPASAKGQIAICVSRLRRSLATAGARVIETASPGYVARLELGAVDWSRFTDLVRRAREVDRSGDRRSAVSTLHQALSLWRGECLSELPGLHADADRLTAAWLDAVELCAEWELALGRHDVVADELAPIVAEHPLRERLYALVMLAHCLCGRRAEALRTYAEARRVLVDQLGLDPGRELRELHERVLREDPSPAAPSAAAPAPARVAPAQLPRRPSPFVGRSAELAALDAALHCRPDLPGIAVVSGPADVGKTALALHWAHHNARRFPDGQLFADLSDEVDPVPVVRRFLRALGVDAAAVPEDADEAVALYRSMVAGRRLLVVLDSAAPQQVRPLLPGDGAGRVLITSRDALRDLGVRQGATRVPLGPMTRDESVRLLDELLGADRHPTGHREAAYLVAASGGSPLFLRRAAADGAHPGTPVPLSP
ncbi:AfsR/SARP family transcriptional regulator [Isoptericola croceus]|uniref:AfsR/SARP family transcriptional regulator n=1 Tax=Isoptericola croceus TaxID=3031406 RepID=UPI0023F902B0|nr:AfsR/SARP family transcriptional regulator [Isoptericola croceus]